MSVGTFEGQKLQILPVLGICAAVSSPMLVLHYVAQAALELDQKSVDPTSARIKEVMYHHTWL